MKRIVWRNKSNGQLCVTIPSRSGIRDGDVVSVEKANITNIVYTPVTGDLFHYGHLRVLQEANQLGDFHICGVLTNDAIASYKEKPVADFRERKSIIEALRCVDMIITQREPDPTRTLEELHEQFPQANMTLVYGSNWKEVPGAAFIKKIGGRIVQPDFYDKLSTERVVKKIIQEHGGG